jgi:hypothetical protein
MTVYEAYSRLKAYHSIHYIINRWLQNCIGYVKKQIDCLISKFRHLKIKKFDFFKSRKSDFLNLAFSIIKISKFRLFKCSVRGSHWVLQIYSYAWQNNVLENWFNSGFSVFVLSLWLILSLCIRVYHQFTIVLLSVFMKIDANEFVLTGVLEMFAVLVDLKTQLLLWYDNQRCSVVSYAFYTRAINMWYLLD